MPGSRRHGEWLTIATFENIMCVNHAHRFARAMDYDIMLWGISRDSEGTVLEEKLILTVHNSRAEVEQRAKRIRDLVTVMEALEEEVASAKKRFL